MKSKTNLMFFRNDDVRNVLDEPLIQITDLFVKYNIPITHAVEPANITKEVIDWLISYKKKHPGLIEIMQHGYDHTIKNTIKKGEFGGNRTYEEQYEEIKKGKELMDSYFGDLWFEAFNFPYAPYNRASIEAVNACEFKVLNSHFNSKFDRKIFYFLGHLLHKGLLFDHHVSWNLDYYPGTNLFEVDMNVSFIKRYYNEETDCEFLSLESLKMETERYNPYKTIGILLHHRYHNSADKIKLVEDFLQWALTQNYSFTTLEKIYEKYAIRK